ncbi:hypothetical protein L246_04860 [Salmonella enterica subsp. enterica serovar Worthington str. BCH-5715]|nr:hypothetical protein L246_04860 [Salmonella enterica subsp. enterica serovar Worthington str. BCH-5715]
MRPDVQYLFNERFLAVDPAMAQKCLAWGANFVAVG